MDLLCSEGASCRAYEDPVLLNDNRVLKYLLKTEDDYMPSSSSYFFFQTELTPCMRKIVADWMLEVCEDQKCQEEVFPLAMNYMDRFLSLCFITKAQLQLVAAVSLLVASKLKEPQPISSHTLAYYSDKCMNVDEVKCYELLLVTKLKWNLNAVTPQDFLSHIIRRLPIEQQRHVTMVRRHAQTFIALCARDHKFSNYTPSMIAGASVTAAVHGLDWNTKPGFSLPEMLEFLHRLLGIEKDYLHTCFSQIEELVRATVASGDGKFEEEEEVSGVGSGGKAGTPTDVRDVDF